MKNKKVIRKMNLIKFSKKFFFSIKLYNYLYIFLKKKIIFLKNNFFYKKYYILFIINFFIKYSNFYLKKNFYLKTIVLNWKNRILISKNEYDVYIYLAWNKKSLIKNFIFIIFRIKNFFLSFLKRKNFIFFSLGLIKEVKKKLSYSLLQRYLIRSFFFYINKKLLKNIIIVFNRISKKLISLYSLLIYYIDFQNKSIYKKTFLSIKYIIFFNPYKLYSLKGPKKPIKKKKLRKRKKYIYY